MVNIRCAIRSVASSKSGFFAGEGPLSMSEDPNTLPQYRSRVNLKDLQPHEVLRYAVGEYIEVFGLTEYALSLAMCHVTGAPLVQIQFFWKDVFISQKIKAVRRAAKEKFGDDGSQWLALKPILNGLDSVLEFRNDIAHGVFISTDQRIELGKPGQSWSKPLEGFGKIDCGKVQSETAQLMAILRQLVGWMGEPRDK